MNWEECNSKILHLKQSINMSTTTNIEKDFWLYINILFLKSYTLFVWKKISFSSVYLGLLVILTNFWKAIKLINSTVLNSYQLNYLGFYIQKGRLSICTRKIVPTLCFAWNCFVFLRIYSPIKMSARANEFIPQEICSQKYDME